MVKLVQGKNDIATTDSWIMPYLVDPNFAYTHTRGSKKFTDVKCPMCGFTRKAMLWNYLKRNKFYCPCCSDGVSYPNKYGRALLRQLPIDFITEYSADWTDNKIFDNYFEYQGQRYVVEMDGNFHFNNSKWNTKENIQQKDHEKNEICRKNNVIIIRINCERANVENNSIKQEVMKSLLADIFDLSSIDWDYCNSFANTSLIKNVCAYYNKENANLTQISNKFSISKCTVARYLKKGSMLGLCVYNRDIAEALRAKSTKTTLQKNVGCPITAYNLEGDLIGSYPSIGTCEKELKEMFPEKNIYHSGIYRVLDGTRKDFKGIVFKNGGNVIE